jgi:hypothetical protein
VFAIFSEGDVPGEWEDAIAANAAFFRAKPGAARAAGKTTRAR